MKKLGRGFGLAMGLCALSAVVFACGSNGGGGDNPTPEAGPPAKPPPPPAPTDDPPAPPPDAATCPPGDLQPVTAADIDKQVGYHAAVVSATACTTGDMTTLDTNTKDTTITSFFDLGKNLSDTCKACVIAKDTDTHWAPIVGTASDNGATGFYDFGACFGAVEGDACGKAIQYSEFCFNIACNKCATTSAARQKCVQAAGAKGGFCEAFGTEVVKSCPNVAQTQNICGNIIDAAKFLCTGTVDAGPG
jgi:hypothetical protein